MAGEADAYLEAFNEAERALIPIKMLADEIAGFARTLQNGQRAAYQHVPPKWPRLNRLGHYRKPQGPP